MPCQYAACFAASSLTRRASGGFRVLATARHTRVCLRAAVLQKPPRCAAAVRLTAANQAAFGIFECARRRGAAFFSRARSARRLLPRDPRRRGVAWRCRFAFALRFKASLLAMLASRSRLARTEAAVHRYARSSSLATSPRSTNHSIHTSCPPRRRTGFSPHCPASLGQTKGAAVTGRPQNQDGAESAAAERTKETHRQRGEVREG